MNNNTREWFWRQMYHTSLMGRKTNQVLIETAEQQKLVKTIRKMQLKLPCHSKTEKKR